MKTSSSLSLRIYVLYDRICCFTFINDNNVEIKRNCNFILRCAFISIFINLNEELLNERNL